MERSQKSILFLVVFVSALLLFQNCGPQFVSNKDIPSTVEPFDDKPIEPDCQFNRNNLFEGDTVIAYQTSTVPTGNQCTSEVRICRSGRLTGTFQYSACLPGVPAACLQSGTTIGHGRSQKFYRASSVAFGSVCESEDRSCTNGTLSGTFGFSECKTQYPTDCTVGLIRFAHNSQKLFFQNKTVPFGEACKQEYRQCHNGVVVNGTYAESECSVEGARNCTHGGEPIGHNLSKPFFKTPTVPFGQTCTSKNIDCYNGVVSGDLEYASKACVVQGAEDCKLFDGTPVAHRGSIIAYEFKKVAFGDVCDRYSKVLRCDNKVLPESAKYKYADCSVGDAAQCVLPDGGTINNGASTQLKKQKFIAQGEACDSPWNIETVNCQNGELTGGTARFQTCEVAPNLLRTPAGGGGGGAFEAKCTTSGSRALGLHGASGAKLDRLGVKCSMPNDTVVFGGAGGSAFAAICPSGKFLTGISGTSEGSYVYNYGVIKSVQLFCANADGSGGAFGASFGVADGFKFYQICPPGYVMHGIKGRSGGLLDQVQAICLKVSDGANINCAGEWVDQGCSGYRGDNEGDGIKYQIYYHRQPAGGNGTACPFPDGDTREIPGGCF